MKQIILALICALAFFSVASADDFSCVVEVDGYSFIEWRDVVLPEDIRGQEFWTDESTTLTIRSNADWYYVMVDGVLVDCAEVYTETPTAQPMNECLGFYAPVDVFYVDGLEYTTGSDGWVSFMVSQDTYWTWTVTIGDWVGYYEQTEREVCHYVDTN